jgi:hypothetical protein
MTVTNEALILRNAWWTARFEEGTGKLFWLVDADGGNPLADALGRDGTDMKEGGAEPYRGLATWIKSGDQPDPNTGVLSAFSPLHGVPRRARALENALQFESAHGGYRFLQTWTLKPGAYPLDVETTLSNESGDPEPLQIEFFFAWSIPAAEWAETAYQIPGSALRVLPPFGDIRFEPGRGVAQPGWYCGPTGRGVVVKAGEGVWRFFCGNQSGAFVLGLLSPAVRLARGERQTTRFQLWPFRRAQDAGFVPEPSTLREAVNNWQAEVRSRAARYPDLASFAGERDPRSLSQRYLHLTFQYSRVPVEEILWLIREVAAPLGFSDLVFEVGRAFPYRSHPRVAAPWAYGRDDWRRMLGEARACGLGVIPEYNSLGHQRESGLGAAYPDLCEDPGCWCLDVDHPRTLPALQEIIGELLEFFEPSAFHLGLDEADVPSRPQTFACPRNGRARDGAELLGRLIRTLHGFLAGRRVRTMMWADMLFYRPEHNSQNGRRTGAWRAIRELPRDIVLFDWSYFPVPSYGSTEYLLGEGFPVVGATWHIPQAVASFARYGAARGLDGLCATTWAPPTFRAIPAICTLMAGRLFRRPFEESWLRVRDDAEAMAFRLAEGGVHR